MNPVTALKMNWRVAVSFDRRIEIAFAAEALTPSRRVPVVAMVWSDGA
ncbi:hypothetical protein QA641_14990 [Bradyrhizobium sp. CB1650]|nr:hypothetical protein [Bradyrhizobium sp. CB1650]WGD55081.1 hypothetical protein QA641_14990 [Bradyrhizobium sp. CB1650]